MILSVSLFGPEHLIIAAISFILLGVGAYFTRKVKLETMVKALFAVGICSEVIKVFYFIIDNEDKFHGYLPKTDLPFHLCSIQIIFIMILYFSKNDRLKRLLMAFMIPSCLFGSIFAILIATESARGMGIITFQYFGYHIAIGIFAIRLLLDKEMKWTVKDYLHSLALLGFFGMLSIYINSFLNGSFKFDQVITGDTITNYEDSSFIFDLTNINFMYTVRAPQEGLPYLNTDHGWFVYIVHYGLLAVFLISLVYIKQIIEAFKKKTPTELVK